MTARLKIAFPYILFGMMAGVVIWSNVGPESTAGGDERHIDPICKMDVNPGWGLSHAHQGKTYYFCTKQCREAFSANPESYFRKRCMVCTVPVTAEEGHASTYLEKTYYLCSEEHRSAFKADPAGFFLHRMWGIPDWLYYASIAGVLVVSFLMFEGGSAIWRRFRFSPSLAASPSLVSLPVAGQPDRIDVARIGFVRMCLRSRPFRFVVQSVLAGIFLLIIAAGLFGSQNPALNIAPLLTWTIWWCGLVVLIIFLGKAWCYMCPWDAIATWMERLRLWKKSDEGTGLAMRWPRIARNIWPATILFVGLTWIELGFGVTMSPRATAYLGIAMLVLAIVCVFLFDRKGFCRYGCLVGRVSGLYAMFAGAEIRPRDRNRCGSCQTKECVKGSESAYGCPTFEYLGKMQTNTYCIQCGECFQACPHDNVAVNLRPWGSDLAAEGKPRRDEAYLALLMLAITAFHGLTMTPVWRTVIESLESVLSMGRIAAFSIGMFGLMGAPILIYAVLVWFSYIITCAGESPSTKSTTKQATYGVYFIRYAYCLLPIALFYHLAHNLEHLLMEGPKVIGLLSDPFGWGWNLLGTARLIIPPLVSLEVLWLLQVLLVGVGHVYSLWAAHRISQRIFTDPVAASRGQWPMLVGMIAFSVLSLWLLKQPMEMRTSAM
jgi:YHS domain-containing protein